MLIASNGAAILLPLVLAVIGIGFYLLPTIIGMTRKVVNVGSVAAINILLGWSLIGWAVAMAMALRSNPVGHTVNVQMINQGGNVHPSPATEAPRHEPAPDRSLSAPTPTSPTPLPPERQVPRAHALPSTPQPLPVGIPHAPTSCAGCGAPLTGDQQFCGACGQRATSA